MKTPTQDLILKEYCIRANNYLMRPGLPTVPKFFGKRG